MTQPAAPMGKNQIGMLYLMESNTKPKPQLLLVMANPLLTSIYVHNHRRGRSNHE